MSSPLKSLRELGLSSTALLIALAGVVLMLLSDWLRGLGLWLLGMLCMFWLAARHDRAHRSRGELPHALWGTNDKNKPRWLTRR